MQQVASIVDKAPRLINQAPPKSIIIMSTARGIRRPKVNVGKRSDALSLYAECEHRPGIIEGYVGGCRATPWRQKASATRRIARNNGIIFSGNNEIEVIEIP